MGTFPSAVVVDSLKVSFIVSIPEFKFLLRLFDTLFTAFTAEFTTVPVEFDSKSDTPLSAEFAAVVVLCRIEFVPFATELIIHSIVSDRLLKEWKESVYEYALKMEIPQHPNVFHPGLDLGMQIQIPMHKNIVKVFLFYHILDL